MCIWTYLHAFCTYFHACARTCMYLRLWPNDKRNISVKRIPQTATPNGRRCSPRGETLRQHATRIQKETLPASIGLRFLPRTGYSRSRLMRKRFLKRETLRLTVTRIHLETAIHAADYPNACLQFVVAFALFSCFYLFLFLFSWITF